MNTIKILDLFAGGGGLSLGFESAKNDQDQQLFELYRAVEIDKYACDTLRQRHGDDRVIEGDITNPAVLDKIINDCKGRVSIVIGGIPCQSFSLIGPRSGYGKYSEKWKEDHRDNLYEQFRDIVAKLEPKIVVVENVKGILSKKTHDGKHIVDSLISDFEQLGYQFENSNNGKKY